MRHFATMFELEMRYIGSMSRQQLLEAIQDRSDCLPADLCEGTEEVTSDHLQLVLLAARFVRALRQMRKHKILGTSHVN